MLCASAAWSYLLLILHVSVNKRVNVRNIWLLLRHLKALSYRILDNKLAKTSFLFREGSGDISMVTLSHIILGETLQTQNLKANSSVFNRLLQSRWRPIFNHVLPFCFVIGWQRRATPLWFPVCCHPPSEAPPSCPAATHRASPNSTAETVRTREFGFWWANRVGESLLHLLSIHLYHICMSFRRPLLWGRLTSGKLMFVPLCGRNMRNLSSWPMWLMKESLEIFLLLNCRENISRDFQKEAEIKQIGRFVILWVFCTVAVNSARRANATCLFIWHEKPAGGPCAGGWRQALTERRCCWAFRGGMRHEALSQHQWKEAAGGGKEGLIWIGMIFSTREAAEHRARPGFV